MSNAAQLKIIGGNRHAEIVISKFRLQQRSPRWVETDERAVHLTCGRGLANHAL